MKRFLIFAALLFCASAQTFYDTSTLVYTHVLFRHGDRTPDSVCRPLFQNPNVTFFPIGDGGLTAMGKNKEFSLGQALRQRYGKFLGDIYHNDLIEATSTDMPRTKMSMQLVLSSIFPPAHDDRWNWNLNWQPIPYNYVSVRSDKTLGYTSLFCGNYNQKYNALMKTSEVQSFLNQDFIKEVTNYLSNVTSITIFPGGGLENVYAFYGCFHAMEQLYQPLPEWSSKVYPDKLKRVGSQQYLLQTWNDELVQYAGGPLIKKIVTDAESKIAGNMSARKISLYSAHEFNVAQTLRALKVFNPPFFPNYGSYVLIELHNIMGEYGFKVFVQNYDSQFPKQLTIPGCSAFCPLIKFKALMVNRMPPANLSC